MTNSIHPTENCAVLFRVDERTSCSIVRTWKWFVVFETKGMKAIEVRSARMQTSGYCMEFCHLWADMRTVRFFSFSHGILDTLGDKDLVSATCFVLLLTHARFTLFPPFLSTKNVHSDCCVSTLMLHMFIEMGGLFTLFKYVTFAAFSNDCRYQYTNEWTHRLVYFAFLFIEEFKKKNKEYKWNLRRTKFIPQSNWLCSIHRLHSN